MAGLSTFSGWCLCSGGGLIGCPHGLEHTFDRPGRTGLAAWRRRSTGWPPRTWTGYRRRLAERVRPPAAGGPPGGPVAARLAAVDARGAAGADQGQQAGSTAGWLRNGCSWAPGGRQRVRTARALFRGPLTGTAQALADGEHLAGPCPGAGPGHPDLPDHVTVEAEPVLLEAARRVDPPRLRRVMGHLLLVADPDGADNRRSVISSGGCGCRQPWRAWWPSTGCWSPRPARLCWRPWSRWPAPADAHDTRNGGQRNADALAELARRSLEGGGCPRPVGSAPAAGHGGPGQPAWPPGAVGGEVGWAGPLDPEACGDSPATGP